ncbi:MAG TPA: alpha/beta fold hydrolase [Burkholderiales bacterium]|nr:alpha/beta fold hydrolase [Burkholderiales bacterium]
MTEGITLGTRLFVLAWLIFAGGCMRLPIVAQTPLKAATGIELQSSLRDLEPDLDLFRFRGPFVVGTQNNRELQLPGGERINTDRFLSAPAGKAPLVIILHGQDSSKEAHTFHAMHLASWGMHSLTVQLPKGGPWTDNGRILARIVGLIHRSPEVIDRRVDVGKIILVGHSFGGYAVAVALAEGAPATGAILLDPAAAGRDVPKFLQQIQRPVMLLGADDELYSTRNRGSYYRFIRSDIAEVSIRNAAHEDAQYPSEASLQNFGIDMATSEELQITFASALTSAAFSLSATGTFEYAWQSFGTVLESGKFFNARRK